MVNGHPRLFEPVRAYRARWGLPDTFALALFEQKPPDPGLGSMASAGAAGALRAVAAHTLAAYPRGAEAASAAFEAALAAHNDAVGLRSAEIDFAGAGFRDLLAAFAFAHVSATLRRTPPPLFDDVFAAWNADHTTVSSSELAYAHHGQAWVVQVVRTAFGRAGLKVSRPAADADWVSDPALGCPAEGFTLDLLREVCVRVPWGA